MQTTIRGAQKRFPIATATKLLLMVVLVVSIVLPLLRMLLTIVGTDAMSILRSERFLSALWNSIAISSVGMLLSVALALALAWCVMRIDIRWRGLWMLLLTLPMLIPSVSHGMGLIVLFGANGVLTNLLHIPGDIYGFWGVVLGATMYSFPVAFLMLVDIFKYEDSSPYEAAAVLGISAPRQLTAITLPYLRRPMIAVFFSIFTLIITDYGVPLMLGTHETLTLPVMMYQDVIEGMDFAKGSVIGLVLLLPALVAFLIDLLNRDPGNASYVTRPYIRKQEVIAKTLAYLLCGFVSLCVLLPIGSFAVLTFADKYPLRLTPTIAHITRTFQMDGGRYLLNSFIIATLVACIGVTVAWMIAYYTARMRSRSSRALHLISIVSLAIPGLVLGLSYALFFRGTFLYSTLAILVLVNLVHFFASPYLMLYNTLGKIHSNLELVGATLGLSRFRIAIDVLVPRTRTTILEAFVYFFVNAMMTISAVSFLANVDTRPLALMIPSFENTMMRESMAFVSLLILTVNLAVKGLAALIKRHMAQSA